MNKTTYRKKKSKTLHDARRIETLFYISIIAVPLFNFIVLQFYQNYIDVFIFSFKSFNFETSTFGINKDIFFNYRMVIQEVFNEPMWGYAFRNGIITSVVGLLAFPIDLIIPLYITKKYFGYRVIKFILILPGMISSMVWTLCFTFFVDRALPMLFGWQFGPLSDPSKRLMTLIIKSIWLGLGGGVIMYTGLFSGIDQGIIDAGQIDGLSFFGEWFHIYMPLTYSIWSLSFMTFFVGFFKGGESLVEFFGYTAGKEVITPGYLLFQRVMAGTGDMYADYGFNCAGSIIFTFITLPITLLCKWALEKYGPSEDEATTRKGNGFKRSYEKFK